MKAAAHLVPLITHNKRLLTIPALRLVYDHCLLTGMQRLLNHKLRCCCFHCMPVEDTGRLVAEISSATSLAHVWPLDLPSCPVRHRCVVWDRQGAVCWIPLPDFFVCRECPSGLCLVSCFLSLRQQCSVYRSRACYILKLIFGASSLAAAVTLPGGVFQHRRHLTALPGLHLIQSSAKFCHKTLQH